MPSMAPSLFVCFFLLELESAEYRQSARRKTRRSVAADPTAMGTVRFTATLVSVDSSGPNNNRAGCPSLEDTEDSAILKDSSRHSEDMRCTSKVISRRKISLSEETVVGGRVQESWETWGPESASSNQHCASLASNLEKGNELEICVRCTKRCSLTGGCTAAQVVVVRSLPLPLPRVPSILQHIALKGTKFWK